MNIFAVNARAAREEREARWDATREGKARESEGATGYRM